VTVVCFVKVTYSAVLQAPKQYQNDTLFLESISIRWCTTVKIIVEAQQPFNRFTFKYISPLVCLRQPGLCTFARSGILYKQISFSYLLGKAP